MEVFVIMHEDLFVYHNANDSFITVLTLLDPEGRLKMTTILKSFNAFLHILLLLVFRYYA